MISLLLSALNLSSCSFVRISDIFDDFLLGALLATEAQNEKVLTIASSDAQCPTEHNKMVPSFLISFWDVTRRGGLTRKKSDVESNSKQVTSSQTYNDNVNRAGGKTWQNRTRETWQE